MRDPDGNTQKRPRDVIRKAVALVTLTLVMGVIVWESEQLASPGPLNPSHARVPELQGRAGCRACHVDPNQPLSEACILCHQVILDQINNGHGLHGVTKPPPEAECERCHYEHEPESMAALVTDFSFIGAGVRDMAQYDHRHVAEFDLVGRHEELECRQCHPLANALALWPGERRFQGLTQECSSCHEDPHGGALGTECASCHGQTHPFGRVEAFVHNPSFPLVGGHAGRTCRACHEDKTHHSVEALLAAPVLVRECAECHQSPHRADFVRLVAALSDTSKEGTCSLCHDAEHNTFLGPATTMPKALHEATRFLLEPPHDQTECAECHAEFGRRQPLGTIDELQSRFAMLFPGRSPEDCRVCHGDPHGGQFGAGATQGLCVACHKSTHFVPSDYDMSDHQLSQFPLTGAHQAVACRQCHVQDDNESPRQFVPTPTACDACHEDVHNGRFDGPDRPLIVDGREGCARCHVTSSFADIHGSSEAHLQWSDYPLKGPHVEVACMACHRPQEESNTVGEVFRQPPRGCINCHVDPHAGQFRLEGVTDCARCHSETPGVGLTVFDHQRDSRFELDEHHRSLACSSCHRPFFSGEDAAVIRYRPLGTKCENCHDSRKRGEMEPG